MIETTSPPENVLKVIEGMKFDGKLNVPTEEIMEHIEYAIRQGHPQARPQPLQMDRIVLLGGGPSLNDTLGEIVELLQEGAKLVTTNGSYKWAIDHNLIPSAQIVLDAREDNARFLEPNLPRCRYLIASQCHPKVWETVKDRENVYIWHAMAPDNDKRNILDTYYLKQWQPISGGSTVISRGLGLLRVLGYLRFDLFGVDSCWMGTEHHAFAQPENQADKRIPVTAAPSGHPEFERVFVCAPWHLGQINDILQMIKVNGSQFLLNVHGDGLLAHVLRSYAEITPSKEGV